MSRDLQLLTPEFRDKVETVLEQCEANGYPMRPFYTIRDVFEQAKLWRQSRTTLQIQQELEKLHDSGAGFLAHAIESVGPQNGPHVTNAIPGLSWHQWGEAVDCFWLVEGRAEWSTTATINGMNGYQEYADIAVDNGLTAGGHWRSAHDWPHVQLRPESSPHKLYSLAEIDAEMRKRFDV